VEECLAGKMTIIPLILIVILLRKLRDIRTRKVRGPSCSFMNFGWNKLHITERASSCLVTIRHTVKEFDS
jgi:hypothetical protein